MVATIKAVIVLNIGVVNIVDDVVIKVVDEIGIDGMGIRLVRFIMI